MTDMPFSNVSCAFPFCVRIAECSFEHTIFSLQHHQQKKEKRKKERRKKARVGGWRELGERKGEIRLTAGVQAKLIDLSSLSQLIINGVFCSSTAQNQLQFTP